MLFYVLHRKVNYRNRIQDDLDTKDTFSVRIQLFQANGHSVLSIRINELLSFIRIERPAVLCLEQLGDKNNSKLENPKSRRYPDCGGETKTLVNGNHLPLSGKTNNFGI